MNKYKKVKKGDIWIYNSFFDKSKIKYKIMEVSKKEMTVNLLSLDDGIKHPQYELANFNHDGWEFYKKGFQDINLKINFQFLKS